MADITNLTDFLDDVAAAIKTKKGYESSQKIPAANFDTEIASINTVNNQNKTITPTTSQQTVTADQGYTGIGTATVNAVTSSIDQNITSNNIRKDVTILGVTGNLEEGIDTSDATATAGDIVSGKTAYANGQKLTGSYTPENLDNVITAQEQKLETLETLLEGKVSGSSKPNIFVQLDEPTTKKGIWLKTNKTPEHYVADDDVVESESWYPDGTYRNIPYSFYTGATVTVGTDIYLLGGYNSTSGNQLKNNFKYDTLTDTYTRNRDMPFECSDASAVSIGTDIYILGLNSNGHYKYDTLTNTYTQLTNIPYSFKNHDVPVAIGTDIYIFGGNGESNYRKAYKYNTLTDTYTQLTNIPYQFYNGSTAVVGTNVYLFGGIAGGNYQKAYKYDTLTDTYTQLTNTPYPFYNGSAITVGTDIYLFGGNPGTTNTYKYNTLTNAYTQLTNIPYGFVYGSTSIVGDKIYLFGGRDYLTKVQCMQVVSKTFEDNSVVISQGRLYNVGYATELFSCSDFTSPTLYAFADAWYYTTQDGLETDIPTYYGNGTQWVNIKNPPLNQGGAE